MSRQQIIAAVAVAVFVAVLWAVCSAAFSGMVVTGS